MNTSKTLATLKPIPNYIDVFVFPFEKIDKGAKVVIYGAGNVGRRYVEQVLEINYCEIVCVVDKQADELCSDIIRLECPSVLKSCVFDYLIIAIQDVDMAEEIRKDLIEKYAIPLEKIVWKGSIKYLLAPSKCIWAKIPEEIFPNDEISICALFGAGFGDAIISKKIIEALWELTKPRCRIDLYVHDITYSFVKGLFQGNPCVKNIYKNSVHKFSRYYESYDLAIFPFYILSIAHYNLESLRNKNFAFAERVVELKNCLDKAGLNNIHKVDNSVLYARAKKLGCNAYTIHSYGGILPINDTHVEIPLLEEKEKRYREILPVEMEKSFITINYGWGRNDHKDEYMPCKIWPFEYYAELVELIKNKYPGIHIVQIGRGNTPQIPKTDMFLLDLDIEILKYVLKDTLIHIDSEGGMVHLATQLGAKCLVAFGPTPVHFFGYESNINVVSGICSDCYFLDDDFAKCFRGMNQPDCMYDIKPEMMFEKFEKYIKEIEVV